MKIPLTIFFFVFAEKKVSENLDNNLNEVKMHIIEYDESKLSHITENGVFINVSATKLTN